MKLVIVGATGFVGTELIHQSLRLSSIKSVIALGRRPTPVPVKVQDSSDVSKLKSVVISDFGLWSNETKAELEGADACIWTLAVTPKKARDMNDFEEVKRVCYDRTFVGLKALFETRNQVGGVPFRFLYMSGAATERDQTKTPPVMPEYCLMRGQVENHVLDFAKDHQGQIDVCVVRPGLIKNPNLVKTEEEKSTVASSDSYPSILVTEVAAAMLDQVVKGFEKDTLQNGDLVRIGRYRL